MFLRSFETTSVGVVDDIVAMTVQGVGQRARERKSVDMGGSADEAHLEFLHSNVDSSASTGRRGVDAQTPRITD